MLTDAQTTAWRALVLAAHSLEEALDRQSRRDGGIPHSHYKLLALLYEAGDKGLPMSALAEQLQYSPSRLTHAVSSLQRSGWAARRRDPRDGRVQRAVITSSGRAIVRAVTPGQVREVREPVLTGWSQEELEVIVRVSDRLRALALRGF
ncbi:DNA-binding MarR family transcriptional regulator [Microbacteriaceae bacterium SG_E_30_P1]|uniref:DNA-binding MarR family transcriptional regulator n=1 Tax=Antiquaquibacter oligotrophicus TaxID=2880260 RepID=A0ABT6KTJ2_9MICO|nr:MarR family transcriptional regulator [Antiquaquibacter oligotrophicus]MDH6182514.1 DNA-binding MarR family transcriptional regulator [Antiquaquibacter oligotrophicus]UDF14516.1 MarR family transcriptional regulator [Antiquaquibacter oligotrophicus]